MNIKGAAAMQIQAVNSVKPSKAQRLWKSVRKNWILYLFLVPTLVYLILFQFWPLYGIQIAFKKFVPAKGIWDSAWVGMKHFEKFFSSYMFGDLLKLPKNKQEL